MNEIQGMLNAGEMQLAQETLQTALKAGAQQCRITLSKSMMNLYGTLNGELDKVSSCLDRAISIALFVDGRFGAFSTNRIEASELEKFVTKAVDSVRLLAPDEFRRLPDPSRTIKDAGMNTSLGISDLATYGEMTPEKRLELALRLSQFTSLKPEGFTLVSEEAEYTDSIADTFIIDSNGTIGRQTDTSFEHGAEITVSDAEGNKFSAYAWQSHPVFDKFMEIGAAGNASAALAKAMAKAGAKAVASRKYTMVVNPDCSSRLLTPVLNALGGYAIQQKNSFLVDTLGKKVFPEFLTINDMPRENGMNGVRLFDTEGVITENGPVIENGVVKRYSINTYISGKTGLAPTVDDVTRAVTVPVEAEALPEEYIYVTGFNGGNCNQVTGDFSYGVEGELVSASGRTPIKEMLVTGNMTELWNNLIMIRPDAPARLSHQIGTLAFKDVDFSGDSEYA